VAGTTRGIGSQAWAAAAVDEELRRAMMMIAFINIKSSLVPLIEDLCAQI